MVQDNDESKIVKLNKKKLKEYIQEMKEKSLIIEIDGKIINQWNDYIQKIGDMLNFPEEDKYPNRDGYLDWMRDLDWIPFNRLLLIINNYKYFMKDNIKDKRDFIEMMTIILKFWNKNWYQKNACYKKQLIILLVD
ncbi:barstar family protein [Fusobacterium sp. PH5-44]|uniref:barstar family protein n=1 Tax=unclassified Fusobacterium TaxID=2648384 RepID=UPI003D1CC695